MEENNGSSLLSKLSFSNFFKVFLLFVVVVNVTPFLFEMIQEQIKEAQGGKINVGVIEIEGQMQGMSEGMITQSASYVKQIRKAADDPKIKAILLKIDSPGGVPGSCELVASQLKVSSQKKPIIAMVENVCASGAYWIASECKKIVCPQSSLIGSIGVLSRNINVKGLAEKFNIKPTIIKAGKYKAIGNPLADEPQDWEIQYCKEITGQLYKVFTQEVAQNRGLDLKKADVWADGKVFSGLKAFELGLVDELGGIEKVEQIIKQETGLEGEIKMLQPPKPSPLAKFFGGEIGANFFGTLYTFAYKSALAITSGFGQGVKLILTA